MLIEVCESDILSGNKRNGASCPITRAINRQLPDLGKIHTTRSDVITGSGKKYHLPDIAQSFIDKFDRGETVIPFSFFLGGIE